MDNSVYTFPLDIRCKNTIRVIDKVNARILCLGCKNLSNLTPYTEDSFKWIANHDMVRGPYNSYHCHKCFQEMTTDIPIRNCQICIESYKWLLNYFGKRNINPRHVYFKYDNLHRHLYSLYVRR